MIPLLIVRHLFSNGTNLHFHVTTIVNKASASTTRPCISLEAALFAIKAGMIASCVVVGDARVVVVMVDPGRLPGL